MVRPTKKNGFAAALVEPPRVSRSVESDPDMEALEALRRPLNPQAAVAEVAYLSTQYREMWGRMAQFTVDLRRVLRTLADKKIPFVLTGAHGIAAWTGRPRATYDVDLLVKAGRNHARAVKAIAALYPELEVKALSHLTAFLVPGEDQSVIDVSLPYRADNEATLQEAVWVKDRGLAYRIPSLECALANKYGAMVSVTRPVAKRAQDLADFMLMVQHSTDPGRAPIDRARLHKLGEKVWSGGGGDEILHFVDETLAGSIPTLTRTHNT